ncbi:conserved hypothetical protein [Desulfosarcina cetonica]|uniref:Lin0512 family protein n=1 Tax=Desulfosarcina cetonica TaxID=90730 RepID=UPI0006D0A9F1|nr:Lin0512 family protein [Desulfosarcina cetonica]VTR64839.1 conserved hypothetical protein [Desulfosarcina cetonica]
MQRKRFIVELGTGADLHGMDVTKAACRAVRDAIGRSCLCGLVEILGKSRFEGVHVAVRIACPFPDQIDEEKVLAEIPIGTRSLTAVLGGMLADGICVDAFGRDCDTIIVANAAVTVSVDPSSVN